MLLLVSSYFLFGCSCCVLTAMLICIGDSKALAPIYRPKAQRSMKILKGFLHIFSLKKNNFFFPFAIPTLVEFFSYQKLVAVRVDFLTFLVKCLWRFIFRH